MVKLIIMHSRFLNFIFCLISASFITLNAAIPDTLSVLSFKQHGESSLSEYYCVISDSTLSFDKRTIHESILVRSVFNNESVVYNHNGFTNIMKLNALSDSVQKRIEFEFAKNTRGYKYEKEYLVKPFFINANVAIYEMVYSVYRSSTLSNREVCYIYVNKHTNSLVTIEELFKNNISGFNTFLQKYLLLHLNEVRPDVDHEIAVLKYQGYKNLDMLDQVAVYGITSSYMFCVFNPTTINNSTDQLILQIPLREVKSFLSKDFLKMML